MKNLQSPQSPGEMLRAALEKKGWSQSTLGNIISGGCHANSARIKVNKICNDHLKITPATARDLAAALGNDPLDWLTCQGAWDLREGRDDG